MVNNTVQVMGIVNVTPDSFSDGGKFFSANKAIEGALAMQQEGAHWLDVGGESTRPGAAAVSVDEELARVVPVIEGIRQYSDTPISIDTSKAEVMQAAIQAGANMINDVCALQQPGALAIAAELQVPVCLMHMQGTPRTMQQQPSYTNIVEEVKSFLRQRATACVNAGIAQQNILFDPGFGFGKSLKHNYQLLAELNSIVQMGHQVLIGISRKSMIGSIVDRPVEERMAGSITAATLAMQQGAHILRVHDVKQTLDAVKVFEAFRTANSHENNGK